MDTSPATRLVCWRRLIALDFDDTIAGQNTDVVARDLLNPSLLNIAQVEELNQATACGWTVYMQVVFNLLSELKFTQSQIREAIEQIDEVPGMVRLIKTLAEQHQFDVIIVSDSNSEFINVWCAKQTGLPEVLQSVFTNPAGFEKDTDHLKIEPYHHQTECALSSANLCKGRVLDEYVRERWTCDNIAYSRIFYVGDGGNDFCPILRLGKADFGCARVTMRLDKKLQLSLEQKDERLQAKVLRWSDGFDLLQQIEGIIADESVIPDHVNATHEILSRKDISIWK